MSRIAILYASRGGQTAAIARRIEQALKAGGHEASLAAVDSPSVAADLAQADAVIVGAGVRYGRHGAPIERLVRRHRALIAARPNAFFSVSLSAGGPRAKPEEAKACVERFVERTGWQPRRVATFAGALTYTRYNPLLRVLMRFMAGSAGGDTDTSRDHVYTDWAAVDRFAREVVPPQRAAA